MKSEQSFCVNTVYIFFKFLLLYSALIPGIFADHLYDYAASISIQDIRSSDNEYFAVDNENSVAKMKTLPFRLNDCTIYLYDYWIGNDSYTRNLYSSPLCTSFSYRQDPAYEDELRYKILFQFLFPNQYSCPMKKGESIIPALYEMPFNYWNLDLPCDTWTYRQAILKQDKSLVKLDLKMNMLPKYKCAPSPSISSDIQNKRHHQFVIVNPALQNEIETQIEAPVIDRLMENFDTSKALSEVQFQSPSNYTKRPRSSNLIIVEPGMQRSGSKNAKNACLNTMSNNHEPETNEKFVEKPINCKWFTLQIRRNCITVLIYDIVKISKNTLYSLF